MALPEQLGKPCWRPEGVTKAISIIAQMDPSRSHYFLASHAPIRGIADERAKQHLDEEGIFRTIFDPSRNHLLAVVHGDPGTGKSHLIHWLKLRTDAEIQGGRLAKVVPVLIERRTGSLKDALDQMIHQLPSAFDRYLKPVSEAIARISVERARLSLAHELFDELGSKWSERGRKPLPMELKNLRELCESEGTRTWLCRNA